jgi:SAM-dependent methyltransferase
MSNKVSMRRFPLRKCQVCGASDPKELFKQEFANIDGVSFLDGYDVVCCRRCNFVYADNIPSQEKFDRYYTEANKYELPIEQPDEISGVYDYIIDEIVNFFPDKSTPIIDIGCARSEILRSLRKLGYTNLAGVDPSEKSVVYLSGYGIECYQGTIGTIDISKQYEVVTLTYVLEHVVDLDKTLSTIRSVTAKNGIVVVCVPDVAVPVSRELPFQEFSREHINYFSKGSLSNLMMQYGFSEILYRNDNGMLTGFFRKCIRNDDIAGGLNYISLSKKYESEIYENLSVYSDTPIIVWGIGTFTQRLLTKRILRNIVALVDSDPRYVGKTYNSIVTISPNELRKHAEPVLLAVSHRYIDAITYTIKNELKLSNEIIKLHADYSFKYI